MDNPFYLGDGLYAAFDGYQIELYAHNGLRKTSAVYLDPPVLEAFMRFVAALQTQTAPPTNRRRKAPDEHL